MIDAAVRGFVRRRAQSRCEYCRLPQEYAELIHHVEHVVARQHGGADGPDNLELSCARCNLAKGPNLSGIDPETGDLVALFHPRLDIWVDHFSWTGPRLLGLTPSGRATIRVLAMNEPRRVSLRGQILASGIALD